MEKSTDFIKKVTSNVIDGLWSRWNLWYTGFRRRDGSAEQMIRIAAKYGKMGGNHEQVRVTKNC